MPDVRHPLIGQVIDKRYRVLDVVGAGSYGIVFSVAHTTLGKKLALKLLDWHAAFNSEIVLRFQREAQATSQLGHENIVDITDFGRDLQHGYYIVMEFLEGTRLDALLDEEGAQPAGRTLAISKQVANALAVAHAHDIVHRDLSASNIIILQRYRWPDFVKVLDFGVAHIRGAERVTLTGMPMGSPLYMSPEQAKGGDVDFRSDIYALGVIMYEMLTAELPFMADNLYKLLAMHVDQVAVPPRELKPELEIPPQVDSMVMRCLQKDPKRRYRSMYTLFEACEAAERVISALPAGTARAHKATPRPKRAQIKFIEPHFEPSDDDDETSGS